MEEKNKKKFTFKGILTISVFLALGIFFVCLEKSGKIDSYFEKKNPPVDISKNMPPPKVYKIGYVTDAHARATKLGEIRMESKVPMLNFVSMMNNDFFPDFVVDGGDFIDGTRRFGEKSRKDHSLFKNIFDQLNAPKYHVLGNHELRGFTRSEWLKINDYEKSYYYFDFEKLRIIVFDSTLVPGSENSSKISEYTDQLLWLEDLLKNSDEYKKIIFTHYPFIPLLRKSMLIEEVEKFNKLASQYRVRAVFSGHVEVPYWEKIGGVDYFVAPGFFRSKLTGMPWNDSFSEINIGLQNSMNLFYKKEGEDDYRSVTIPSPEYSEMKKEIMNKVDFLAPAD